MSIQKASRLAGLTSVTCLFLVLRCTAPALAQLYWDTNGKTGGAGYGGIAPGVWGVGSLWTTSAGGTSTTRAWSAGEQAVFSAGGDTFGAFTISLSGNQVASGLVFQEGSVTLRDGSLTLRRGTGGGTISVASDLSATIDSTLLGTDGLIKDGDGTLILAAANSYSGLTDLRRGTLVLASDYGIGTSTLNLNGGSVSAGDAPVSLNNQVRISDHSTIGGMMDLILGGNVTQCGGDWTLRINNAGRTTFSGDTITLSDSAKRNHRLTLDVTGGEVTITANIIDGGPKKGDGLVKSGSGRLVLTGDNSFSGGLDIENGTLVLGSDSAAGTGELNLGRGVEIGGINGTRYISNELIVSGDVTFSGSDLVFASDFRIGGVVTFTVENTTTFNGKITGGFVWLTKNGSGTLVLNGPNHFGGLLSLVSIDAGTFGIGNDTAAGKAENLLLLNGGGLKAVGGEHTLANPVILMADTKIGGAENLTLSGSVNNLGEGNRLLVNNTGVTTFSGSTFNLGASMFTVDVSDSSGGLNIAGQIQNGLLPASLVKEGGGTLTLSGTSPNMFTGGLDLNGGTIVADKRNALGTGSVTINSGRLDLQAFDQTIGSLTLVAGAIEGRATLTAPDFRALSGSVSVSLAGPGSLVKDGPGTLILAGESTYSGGTSINGGTVIVRNHPGSGTGPGPVRVNNGGVLAGTGFVAGPITLNHGGSLAPGLGVGALSSGDEIWNAGSILRVDISDVDSGEGVGWDFLSIAGSLSIQGRGGDPVFVDLRSLDVEGSPGWVHDFDCHENYSWRIVATTEGIRLALGETVEGAFAVRTSEFQNDVDGGVFSLGISADGRDLMLSFTSVPEPHAASMAILGFLLLFVRFRFSPRSGASDRVRTSQFHTPLAAGRNQVKGVLHRLPGNHFKTNSDRAIGKLGFFQRM